MAETITNASTSTDFSELVRWFGLPGAIFLVVIVAMVRGWLVPGRELNALYDRLERLREEKNYWRDLAMSFKDQQESAVRVVEKAVEKLPRTHPTQPPSPPDGGE